MSATKPTNGKPRKHKAPAADSPEVLSSSIEEISPAIANRVKGKPPHPSANGTTTPAGIAVNDPDATGFSDEPPEFKPLSGRTLERDYGGKTLSNMLLGVLVRHPDNRQPTEEAVAKMAASIEKEGLLDPLVVRSLGDGRWQIISGETRYLALKKLGRKQCDAHVVNCDDARALELLAIYNAERTDLNAIEKARLIDRLCQPTEQGGGGMTREAAAKIYGLETGAAASNLVGLLKLPKVWQDRVASGEFPQTFARCLVAYAHAPRILEALNEDWEDSQKNGSWAESYGDREAVEQSLDQVAEDCTRPIDAKTKHRLSWKAANRDFTLQVPMQRLFELTPELEKDLDIVELKDGKGTVKVATNWKLWDKLQIPLLRKAIAKGKKASVGASSDDKPATKKPKVLLSPAALKAKAKEQERILEQRIARWRHAWLRDLVAEELKRLPTFGWQHLKLLLWLTTQPQFSYSDEAALELPGLIVASAGQRAHEYVNSDDAWEAMHAKYQQRKGYADQRAGLEDIARQLLQKLFHTQPKNPDYQIIPLEVIEGAASDLSIDLASAWIALQHAADRTTLETFFELHNGEQLDTLAKELGLIATAAKKSEKVRMLASSSASGRLLKLPKSIKPLPAPEAAAAGGKKKKGGK